MSAGIIIVLIIVVWLFVLAPLLLRGQRPIRKAGKAFNDTRVLHEGGSAFPADVRRKLRPREDDVRYEDAGEDDAEDGYEVVTAEAEDAEDRAAAPHEDVVDGDVIRELEAPDPATVTQQVAEPGEEPLDDAEDAPAEHAAPAEEPEAQQAGEAPEADEGDDEMLTSPEDMLYADGEGPAEPEPGEASEDTALAEEPVEPAPQEPSDELTPEELEFAARRRGRGGWDPQAAPEYAKLRYQRRQRMLLSLVGVLAVTVVVALIVGTWTWWLVAAAGACVVVYLVALRRQVRQEEELRRRRIRQLRRARLGVRHRDDEELAVPRQLRRLGALVVEIDDESPDFAHLSRVRLRPTEGGDNGTPDAPSWRGHKVAG